MKQLRHAIAAIAFALLAACGGGSDQIGGTITGLTASGLVLSNGTDTLGIAANSSAFTFPTVLTDGTAYNVVVSTQPTGLQCTVANGSGTASSTSVSPTVVVTCNAVFSISGTITGPLTSTGLQLSDGKETITIASGAGSFAFPTQLATGTGYTITVSTQPSTQICSVLSGGTGTIGSVAVSNVTVNCLTQSAT